MQGVGLRARVLRTRPPSPGGSRSPGPWEQPRDARVEGVVSHSGSYRRAECSARPTPPPGGLGSPRTARCGLPSSQKDFVTHPLSPPLLPSGLGSGDQDAESWVCFNSKKGRSADSAHLGSRTGVLRASALSWGLQGERTDCPRLGGQRLAADEKQSETEVTASQTAPEWGSCCAFPFNKVGVASTCLTSSRSPDVPLQVESISAWRRCCEASPES